MRILLWLALLGLLATTTYAWTKEDYEIFDLVSAIEASEGYSQLLEGKDTSFYSWLDVSPSASSSVISRAYRKKSVQLHPDKNPGVKGAHERFARLGVVAQILRNKEGRERYDFFFKNGVPKWRGTGYYYSRYRPGLGSVFVFLVILTSGLQYVIQRINYKSDLVRIERFVREARLAAWGPKMQQLEGKKKVKVNLGGKGYLDEDGNWIPGKQLDMLVEGEDVFILEPNGDLLPLDAGAASPPSVRRTWFMALVTSMYHKSVRRVKGQDGVDAESESTDFNETDEASSDGPGSGSSTPIEGSKGRAAAMKAGGRRRKQTARKQR